MPAPYNYTAPQIDLGQAFSGLNATLNEAARIRAAQEEAQRQREEAMRAQQAYAQDLQSAFGDPRPESFAKLIAKYPAQREALGDAAKIMQTEAGQKEWSDGIQIASALENGATDVARQMIQDRVAAAESAGKPAGIYGQILSAIDRGDVKSARGATNFALSMLDPEKFGKFSTALTSEQSRPEVVAETSAKAKSAAIAAKFAESKAVAELKLTDAQIQKMAADTDIARMNARIAAMNAQTSKEGNDLKRRELSLKIDEMMMQRDEKVREKVATVESGRMNMDNMLNTIDRVLKNPSLNDVIGSFEGRMPGAASMLDDQESDAIALIDTLGSQAFLAQIPNIKGMGALSNAEGEKLQSALQNLSRSQSEKQFRSSLGEAQRLILKARKNLGAQYGVRESAPDTPAARPSGAEVDAILKELGVK